MVPLHSSSSIDDPLAVKDFIRTQFGLLKNPDATVRRTALDIICRSPHWDEIRVSRKEIKDTEVIPRLTALLKNEDTKTRRQAALALGHLAYESHANQADIKKAGAIAPLIVLLRKENAEVRKWADDALKGEDAEARKSAVFVLKLLERINKRYSDDTPTIMHTSSEEDEPVAKRTRAQLK